MIKVRRLKKKQGEFIVDFGDNIITKQSWEKAKDAYAWLKSKRIEMHEMKLNRI